MPRTNTQGETISAHDQQEDCPPAMTNEAAQAGEREAFKRTVREAGGIVHSDGNIFFTNAKQFLAAALAALPAVQPAESGEPVAYIVRDVEGGSLRDFGDEYSADQYLMQNRARMLKPQVLFCYEKPVAALPQPATTEAGDGVLNKAQVCAALANAGLMLVKTEHGLRVEKAVTGATAYSVSATPVAAVAQPVTLAWVESGFDKRHCHDDEGKVRGYIERGMSHTRWSAVADRSIGEYMTESQAKAAVERAALAASPSSERQDVGGGK